MEELIAQHKAAMERLYEAVAKSRGLKYAKLNDDGKMTIVDFATKLCEGWDGSPGLREKGVGDSIVLCRVAEQYAIAQRIMAAENDAILTGRND